MFILCFCCTCKHCYIYQLILFLQIESKSSLSQNRNNKNIFYTPFWRSFFTQGLKKSLNSAEAGVTHRHSSPFVVVCLTCCIHMNNIMSSLTIITIWLTLLVVGVSCLLTGNSEFSDGDLGVSSDTILNQYYKVVQIDNTKVNLTLNTVLNLIAGSLIFVYQPNGATMDESNNDSFGNIIDMGSAGIYEFGVVSFCEQNVVVLNSPLLRDFQLSNKSSVQMVVVPQFRNLTITSGARVLCEAWDSTKETGGLVVIHAKKIDLTVGGLIECDSGGFSGGVAVGLYNSSQCTQVFWLPPISTTIAGPAWIHFNGTIGAAKGEGLRKLEQSYVNRYGRGAPANGGGGGSIQNSGGGGGSNVGTLGGIWDGSGIRNATYASIWLAVEGANTLPTPGGGRGGYSWNFRDQNFFVPANCSAWGGDGRQNIGGRGGRPLPIYPNGDRIFYGGGGGAGDANNFVQGSGGNGGGMIFVVTDTIKGSGLISADGGVGGNANIDGAGGGGAGGTVFIISNHVTGSSVDISARGGMGGITYSFSPCIGCLTGPGGGGGGGMIWIDPSVMSSSGLFLEGGTEGISNRTIALDFPPSGATSGASTDVSHFITSTLCSMNPIPCITIHNPSLTATATPTNDITKPPTTSPKTSTKTLTSLPITSPFKTSQPVTKTPTKPPKSPRVPNGHACSTDCTVKIL
jgi:hypothetical protein